MRKILTLLFVLIGLYGYSQEIEVNKAYIRESLILNDSTVTGITTGSTIATSQWTTTNAIIIVNDTAEIVGHVKIDSNLYVQDTILMVTPDTTFIKNKLKVTDGAIYIDGRIITPSSASAYIASGDEASTTISIADTYYFMKGAFTNIDSCNFQFTGDTLQYIGSETIDVIILYTCTFGVGQVNTLVTTGISVNDVVLGQSEMDRTISATSDRGSWAGLATSLLNTNDKIKIIVKANKTGTVTAYKFSTAITD